MKSLKIRIGDHHYRIEFHTKPWAAGEVGCCSSDGCIKVLVGGSWSETRNTLCHEILHAIFGVTNQRNVLKLTDEQEEAFVLAFTPLIIGAFEDLGLVKDKL